MNIQDPDNPSNSIFAKPKKSSSLGPDNAETGNELQMMQKKAVLYNIKNQLLKYDNFQGVSNEELQNLYNNLQQQSASDRNEKDNRGDKKDADLPEGNSHESVDTKTKSTKFSFLPINKTALLRFCIIILVILCISMKLSQTNYKQFNIGQFSVYSTKYDKSPTQIDILKRKKLSLWGHLVSKLQGSDQQSKIKLYLPNTVPRVKIYDLNKPTEEDCLLHYRPVCIDYRLTTFGSMNIELQACILDILLKPQHILFQGKVDNFLPILITGEKLKRIQLFSQQKYQVTVLESDQVKVIEMNSLKLSIIDSNLQTQVKIFKIKNEKQVIRAINQHQYAIVSQKLFELCLNSQDDVANTIFIINLPQGITRSFQKTLIQMVQSKLLKIQEIRPIQDEQKSYAEAEFISGQAQSEQFYRFSRILVIKILAKIIRTQPKVEAPGDVAIIEDKREVLFNLPASLEPQQPQQQYSPPHHLLRKLGIKNHPCITQDGYGILSIDSVFADHQYLSTIIGFKLLVNSQIAPLYRSQGALSPELLFFIAQNVKNRDKIFIANELFFDDLIVLTLANTIRNKENLHCVYTLQKHETLTQNLRVNSLADLVSFQYLNKDDQKAMAKYYQQNNFTVFFTSIGYFSRDYTCITTLPTLPTNDRMIIFLWNSKPSYNPFMRKITKMHQVWVILQRSDIIKNQNTCLNYGLMPFKADDVGKMNNVWVVVQL